jgi:hypothetical protein
LGRFIAPIGLKKPAVAHDRNGFFGMIGQHLSVNGAVFAQRGAGAQGF